MRRPRIGAICAAVALLAIACGTSGPAERADPEVEQSSATDEAPTAQVDLEPTTTSEQVAAATADSAAPVVDAPTRSVSFSEHVLPVLERSCASCHGPDQAGASGLVLATAADAVEASTYLELVTHARSMPPWPASALSVEFEGDTSLSDDEILAIADWVAGGSELDIAPDTPIVSSRPASYLEDPEIVMTSAAGAFAAPEGTRDDYRCLVFEPGNTEKEWILGTHFVPDQVEVVHHGIITLASAELREQAAWLDSLQEGPGWTCFGGTGLQTNEGGETFRLGGWAPGGQPSRQPAGYALPLDPGDFVIVQVHYHYEDDYPADLSQFQLDLASDEEIEAVGGEFKTLRGQLYLGPAEIPCYAGDTHPLCDRDAAVARVQELYGQFIGGLPNYFLWQCGSTPEDYAHMDQGDAWSTCDLPVKNPGRIVSVTGHMHELGASIRLTLNPDTPEERILLDIPDWDFEWQFGYRPVEDIVIDTDDIIRVDCSWNRERAPYEAVGYVLWSDGTGDEMCYSNITTAPES